VQRTFEQRGDLYRATPVVTRALGFSGLIRRTTPIQSPLTKLKGMLRTYSYPNSHGSSDQRTSASTSADFSSVQHEDGENPEEISIADFPIMVKTMCLLQQLDPRFTLRWCTPQEQSIVNIPQQQLTRP
jgi:hypothetical protein